MIAAFAAIALAASAAVPADEQRTPGAHVTAAATQLFERDWVLMNWALKFYDGDEDVLLSPAEAAAAAAAFRKLADGDDDGRITPLEYRQARAFIMSRY